MQKRILAGIAGIIVTLGACATGWAQTYSNTVVGLNPAGYWPLNESAQPPQLINLTATNSGSLGAAGNGFYGAWYQQWGNQWYLTNNIVTEPGPAAIGDTALNCQYQPGQYIILPRNTNGVANSALTITPPFSIEAWINPGTIAARLGGIISEGEVQVLAGGSNPTNPFYGGTGPGTSWAGFAFGQYTNYFFFSTFSTNGYNVKNTELDGPKNLTTGQWVYVVCTFTAAGVETMYTNGVYWSSKTVPKNAAGQYFVADLTSPLMIGSGSDAPINYGNPYQGGLAEVAIYNQALGSSQVLNHYQAATSVANYTNAVLADGPTLYFRMNDGEIQTNAAYPSASFPVANNYGTLSTAASGVYQPGTTPGVAGPPYAGFGANSKGVAINGWLGAVDVGSSNLPSELNPTGAVPLTVVSWFQTGPADSPGRYQEILGHGDLSYRIGVGQNPNYGTHFNPGPGPELQFTSAAQMSTNGFDLNDHQWHMAAGVSDGTNEYLYLDGSLALTNSNPAGINILGTNLDVLLGGDPQYTYASTGIYNTIRNFDGQIAQVAFFTNALTASQIRSLFNAAGVPPFIVTEPISSVTANQGQNVTVSSVIRGSGITYQWYQNGVAVSGQTNASLSYVPAVASDSGSYELIASSAYGSVTSSIVTLTVYGPPVIMTQSPTQLEIFSGSSPTLYVTASGANLAYQWTLNSAAIAGATNSTYTVPNITSSATYGCTLSNTLGTTNIAPVAINVLADPTAPYPAQVLANHPVAYYRLDEAPGSPTAYDYVGGFNADYTNVVLGIPGYTSPQQVPGGSDPTETCALFGSDNPPNNLAAGITPLPNFAQPGGSNAEFSVEAWVNQGDFENGGNCIVGRGYGGGGEQFVLDSGAISGASDYLRFFVRNAAGTAFGAASTVDVDNDGKWHHVVGVCDEAGGHVILYMDGAQIASTSITNGAGLQTSFMPLTIGARESANNNPTNYDYQFYGFINDVSLYNRALTAAQVQADYLASGTPPMNVQVLPSNLTTNQNATAVFAASTQGGTAPFSYQWQYNNNNIPGATNSTLALPDVQPGQDGTYSVTVSNPYGSSTAQASLTVSSGPATVAQDVMPAGVTNFATTPITLSIIAAGTLPIDYQWYQDGVAVAGANSASYTFDVLAGTNTYYCAFSNSLNSAPVTSSAATVVGVAVSTLNPASYNSRLKITFTGYTNSETLQDFPALVRLSPGLPGFNYAEFAGGNGSDLRFTDSGGTRELPYEIVQWDNTNGVSTVWVQIPQLFGGTNNYIWAYWGNPSDTTTPTYTTNGSVWEPASFLNLPGYDVVYHLQQTNFPYLDSTLQYPALDGSAPASVPGIIGNGALFNNNYLDAGDVNLGNQFTMSAWVDPSASENNIAGIWVNGPGGYYSDEVAFFFNDYNTADGAVLVGTGDGLGTTPNVNGSQPETATGLVAPGSWNLVTAAINRSAQTIQFYVNGTPEPVANGLTVTSDFPTNADMYLGRFTTPNFPFIGIMDEARIHGGIDDSNWVWADYQTVENNSTFATYSSVTNTIALPITLKIRLSGNQAILTWPAGTLQSASQLNGPYSNVTGATSPYTTPVSGAQEYYRVQAQF